MSSAAIGTIAGAVIGITIFTACIVGGILLFAYEKIQREWWQHKFHKRFDRIRYLLIMGMDETAMVVDIDEIAHLGRNITNIDEYVLASRARELKKKRTLKSKIYG